MYMYMYIEREILIHYFVFRDFQCWYFCVEKLWDPNNLPTRSLYVVCFFQSWLPNQSAKPKSLGASIRGLRAYPLPGNQLKELKQFKVIFYLISQVRNLCFSKVFLSVCFVISCLFFYFFSALLA